MNSTKRRSVMEEWPEEMLMEILVKLPAKRLIRSSCVCKAWCDLIRKHYFTEKHSKSKKNNNNEDTMVFASCWDYNKPKDDQHEYRLITDTPPFSFPANLELLKLPRYITLAGSCNGIICLAPMRICTEWQTVVLYIPITKQHRVLPPGLLGDALFRSQYGYHILGFGFDKSSNDYKVVRICYNKKKRNRYAEIYRVSTNCWRKIECRNIPLLDYMPYPDKPNGVFLNGSVHWAIAVNPHNNLYTFNFETEEFGKMECTHQCDCLTTVGDLIAVVSQKGHRDIDDVPVTEEINVWVMEEYGKKESWTMKFSVQWPYSARSAISVAACWISDMNQLLLLTSCGQLIIIPGNDEPILVQCPPSIS